MTRASTTPATPPSLFAGYSPLPGVYDEAFTSDAQARPHWQSFNQSVEALGTGELAERWNRAQAQIVRDGVTFNPYDAEGDVSRPWTLDALPLLIAENEWRNLSAALEQRATLLEKILADLFGQQHLLRDKIIPPELLYGHPGFYPAYHGLQDATHRHLHFYAADLARSQDGSWWVTADRTRAPFGLGYVLENRIVTARMLPAEFRSCNVRRLAEYFVTARETVRELAPRAKDNPHIALWTKGPKSRAYFEDAYLARYLGYTLVEGGDLAVRENRIMLKTLGGLVPVEVLVRRLDDEDCDPLELRTGSGYGVSGFLEVYRAGHVAIANTLGTRLVESPIFLAFLPHICKHLLGEELKLPSVATWWCGQPKALEHVAANLDNLLIRPAYHIGHAPPIHAASLTKEDKAKLIEKIRQQPERYTAQEVVSRSTSPVWIDGAVQPWRLALRTFLFAAKEGYTTLPGGLARISPEQSVLDFTMTSGERSQDVWVLSDQPVEEVTLLAPPEHPVELKRTGSELPSRVADNLFWLGRMVERAEGTVRLLRSVYNAATNESPDEHTLRPLLQAMVDLRQLDPNYPGSDPDLVMIESALSATVFDRALERGLQKTTDEIARLISIVRDRVSVDSWRVLRRVSDTLNTQQRAGALDPTHTVTLLDQVLTDLLAFAGLATESMTRTQGWRFLDLGRRIERAWRTAKLLNATLVQPAQDETELLEWLLKISDSFMTYRNRYLATFQVPPALDLLICDESNPRAIGYQLRVIESHVNELPRFGSQAVLSPEQRLTHSLRHSVRLADVYELTKIDSDGTRNALSKMLLRLIERFPKLSDEVSSRFLIHAGTQRHLASSEPANR